MHKKLGCDTFIYDGTMLEDLSGGAWFVEEMPRKYKKSGMMFRPQSALTYEEFLASCGKAHTYCLTFIGQDGTMTSYKDLSYMTAMEIIQDLLPKVMDGDTEYLQIFNQADSIKLDEYLKEMKAA